MTLDVRDELHAKEVVESLRQKFNETFILE